MQILNNLKRSFTLTREALIYIKKYPRIYKRVVKEAKKKKPDSDRYVIESVDRTTKGMWQLINREIEKLQKNKLDFEGRK